MDNGPVKRPKFSDTQSRPIPTIRRNILFPHLFNLRPTHFAYHFDFKYRYLKFVLHAYKILVGMPEGKRPLGRPRRRWQDNVKMYLKETGFGVWIGIIWLRIGTGGGLL
jgi:hypothetical protein